MTEYLVTIAVQIMVEAEDRHEASSDALAAFEEGYDPNFVEGAHDYFIERVERE